MLLKDCPVGSFVKLVSIKKLENNLPQWQGKFRVFYDNKGKYVIDKKGAKRLANNYFLKHYQFEIVSPPHAPKTITLNNKTYILTPHTECQTITIDGVTYDMQEQD